MNVKYALEFIKHIQKRTLSYEVLTIADTDQNHIEVRSAPDLIIQFVPTHVFISVTTVYIIFSIRVSQQRTNFRVLHAKFSFKQHSRK